MYFYIAYNFVFDNYDVLTVSPPWIGYWCVLMIDKNIRHNRSPKYLKGYCCYSNVKQIILH